MYCIKALDCIVGAVLVEIFSYRGDSIENLATNHMQKQFAYLTAFLVLIGHVHAASRLRYQVRRIVWSLQALQFAVRKCEFRQPFDKMARQLPLPPFFKFVARADGSKGGKLVQELDTYFEERVGMRSC